ncbi:hypothetical protein HK097_005587 [Rhizophlyctis rosea]|uniref:L-serine-phosphatidylethanolamine phosphatidyltransferase n=1 Tax=Rhizophlyctis rosea TaxID=64517 RepID=A0AAD5X5H3_9FUNG|nr:hypothetical protein HK097_005587 [Rhizophlyctis rosea]
MDLDSTPLLTASTPPRGPPSPPAPETSLSDSELITSPTTSKYSYREAWEYQFSDELDPTVAFFYKPRTVFLLIGSLIGLVYLAFTTKEDDPVFNTKVGLSVAAAVLMITGLLQFRDGPFIRPHPAFWRVILSLSVIYEMLLVFILFQQKGHMRHLMTYIDPSLGVPLPERNYADNCEITSENLWNQMDIFVIAHSLGWFAKAIILRDYWFCWILSIMFEIMEYSLAHQLPNFAECWWDHWILDLILTNWVGTVVAIFLERYQRDSKLSGQVETDGAAIYTTQLDTLRVGHNKIIHELCGGLILTLPVPTNTISFNPQILQCELNAFYLKFLLWLPPEHFLNIWRLILYFFMALPAVRELYQFISDRRCKRLGMHAWMATANIMTELLINIKFGKGEFPEPAPKEIIYFWIGFVVLLFTYAVFHFLIPFLRGRNARKSKSRSRSNSRSGSPVKNGFGKVGKSKAS